MDNVQPPLIMRLPIEIRLIIYDLLLLPSTADTTHTTSFARILPAASEYHDYEHSKSTSTPSIRSNILKIRTEDPTSYLQRRAQHTRTAYMIRSDRFRARCMSTTYHLLSNPSLHTSILGASHLLHAECTQLLYSSYVFDFDTHVEALVPFFSDLTPLARRYVRGIRIVKRALPYEKEFDRAEWSNAISYVAENMDISSLSLGIVVGKSGPSGWDGVVPYNAMDFGFLKEMDGMEWVQELLALKGLEELKVEAIVEHCPPPMSTAMARYIKFSASVEGSFAEYIRGEMLV